MTDITWVCLEEIAKHGITGSYDPSRKSWIFDEFAKEAYRINSHIASLHSYLQSIRQPYLSLANANRRLGSGQASERRVLNDAQREEIDAESKGALRDLNASISNLDKAEEIRQNTEATLISRTKNRKGFGALGRWAAGGIALEKTKEEQAEEARINGVNAHRESVIWFLRRKLESCGEVQRSMMEIRLKREVEKSKSILYKSQESAIAQRSSKTNTTISEKSPISQAGLPIVDLDQQGPDAELHLTPEQLTLFAEENESMVKHYEETLNQVRNAERSLIEISELQTTLAGNLEVQAAHIDQLVADSIQTTENVGGGNKELKRATERKSTAKLVFYSSCAFSLVLILYDLII